MFKVLHVMAGADAGGISSVVVNYYSNIDRSKIHFDVAITTSADGINGIKLRELGANVYKITLKSENRQAYKNDICQLIERNKYDIIHVHESHTSWVALKVAQKCGVKYRIAHSHVAGPRPNSVKSILRRLSGVILNAYYATTLIACGQKAGEFVFGAFNMKRKKAFVLPNAIDTSTFRFDDIIRSQVRAELNLEDKFIVGMVGRVAPQKNYLRSILLFKEIKERISNAVLVVAGDGEDMPKLRQSIIDNKMSDCVVCLGNRNDVYRLLQAFDIFILPSLYEGFPVAAVEALATGLPVLMSDTITKELEFGSAVRYLPLSEPSLWASTAAEFVHDDNRDQRVSEIKQNGLDIHQTAKILQNFYLSCNA